MRRRVDARLLGRSVSKNSSLVLGGVGPRFAGPERVERSCGRTQSREARISRRTHPMAVKAQFGYELGAGRDIRSRHQRLAYRVEGDMVGTTFSARFNTVPRYPRESY